MNKKRYKLNNFDRIAIIQTAFIGDSALTLYLCQKIKEIHPDSTIYFICTPSSAPIIACCNAIDHVITYDKHGLQSGIRGLRYMIDFIKENNINCIISPHRSLRSTLMTYFSKPEFSISFDKSALSILYKKRVKYYIHLHEINRNFELLKPLGISFEENESLIKINLDIHPADKTFVESKLIWANIHSTEKIVALAPGSVWQTKKWDEEYYIELAKMLKNNNYKVVIIGSKEDKELCNGIAENSGTVNFAGETTLPQTLHLLSICSLTVTNDSAPTHLACLVNCPVLTIYGATSPKFGFGPTGKKDKIIEVEGLKCKPCGIHGSNKCPIGTHECMTKLKPKSVFDLSLEILNGN